VNSGCGAHGLGEDIGNASALHNSTHSATCDYTSTWSSWTKQNCTSSIVTQHRVGNGATNAWNSKHVLLSVKLTLSDSCWN
ncbi:hypothetical protein QP265_25550, partial [Escherichia coli]|nr:hypothetical protein [Escherichia coli]